MTQTNATSTAHNAQPSRQNMRTGHFSLPFWGSVLTFLGIVILATLSYWQVKRMHWKDDVVEKLATAYDSPKPLRPYFQGNNDAPLPDFIYGTIKGRAHADKAIALGPKTLNGNIGHHIIVPVTIKNQTMLVNLGWSAQSVKDINLKPLSARNISYEGLARAPDWNSFTSKNSPDRDLWFRADIAEIAQTKALKNTLPYMLYATDASRGIDSIIFHEKNWYPRNKHRQYAIFWAVMALCLAGVYILRFKKGITE